MKKHGGAVFGLLCAMAIAAVAWKVSYKSDADTYAGSKSKLGLMTSLPIYWNEAADLGGMLDNEQSDHWVRARLEKEFELIPLDILAAEDSAEPSEALAELELRVLAQPRALPPADFVALDEWVRGGGVLLMFADPMLTEHSDFGFGDQRRPQDVALLSPILTRWDLAQFYDENQEGTARSVMLNEVAIPIRKAGRFEWSYNGDSACTLEAEGAIASCRIGEGRAVIVADAAVLEGDGDLDVAEKALDQLLQISLNGPKDGWVH